MKRTGVLAAAFMAFAVGLANATPVSLQISGGGTHFGGMTGVSGDPAVSPLSLPPGYGASAVLTQSGPQFGLTGINLFCGDPSGCGWMFDLAPIGAYSYPASGALITIDGGVITSNPSGVSIGFSMFARSGYDPNPYGYNVYDFSGQLTGLTTGSFEGSWYQGPLYPGPAAPGYPGGVATFRLYLTVGGLQQGDSVTLPGSFGMNLSAPPQTVPDPSSTLLLLGMGLVGLRAWRKREQ